jgi:uncharacterized membrane protein (UPF0127 family)
LPPKSGRSTAAADIRRIDLGGGGAVTRRSWASGVAIAFSAALAWTVAATFVAPALADPLETLTISTQTGDHAFSVEIAATPTTRERGLMDRRFMPMDRGMLFEFERDGVVDFWMKNTYIPLDMVFIARNGAVTRIVDRAEPLSETPIPSGGPCAAVLELNGGVAARIGLKIGDKVRHVFFRA